MEDVSRAGEAGVSTQMIRVYQCPGCSQAAEMPVNWRGVFCSQECKQDAASVRAMRKEIEAGRSSPATQAMAAVWEEMNWYDVDYQKNLPPRSAAMYERVFFPVPVYPADREDWPKGWQAWKKERSTSQPVEVFDFSSYQD